MGSERGCEFYDKVYAEEEKYSTHYRDLKTFPVFQVALSMVRDIENPKILEVGCGTGQFAQMLWDNGILCYKGVDFSEVAVGIAHGKSPQAFEVGDIEKCSFDGFNTVVALEVFEHIEEDIELIKRIPEGTHVIFSVPNFNDSGHVRHFKSSSDILNRYGHLISVENCVKFIHWYILKGVRNGTDVASAC